MSLDTKAYRLILLIVLIHRVLLVAEVFISITENVRTRVVGYAKTQFSSGKNNIMVTITYPATGGIRLNSMGP